jgi:hypothetical protein
VRQPIDAAQSFVLSPLETIAPTDVSLAALLARYRTAVRDTGIVEHNPRAGRDQRSPSGAAQPSFFRRPTDPCHPCSPPN